MGFTTNIIKAFLPSAVLLLAIAGSVSANSTAVITVSAESIGGLGVIKGVVRDEAGSPINDASVAVFRPGTSKLLKQVTSAADGSFIARIIPGTYTILAVAQGFNPSTLFGVQVGRASELSFGFKLERAGSGNTLPEKRLDRNSSKWRIRAAQSQRSIYQNSEGDKPVIESTDEGGSDSADRSSDRKGQTVVETYFAAAERGNNGGVNFATQLPTTEDTEIVVAGQVGIGKNAPLRLDTSLAYSLNDRHDFKLNTSVARLGSFALGDGDKQLGQVAFQAFDEWKIREGIILVYGLDYVRFFGAGDDSSISPRLGLQFDLNTRTRLRSAYTTQTETRNWATAIELEGRSVAFAEPIAVDDLVMSDGKPKMNRSRRVEFGIERVIDSRSSIEANAFIDTTFGRGVGIDTFNFNDLESSFNDIVADQEGRADGVSFVYTRRFSGPFTASAGYSFGRGQKISTAGIVDTAHIFENDFFQSFFAQVAADLKTGTSIRTIYRLSPDATVFAIDPFKGRLAIYDPGLSVLVTQRLPNLGLPFKAQAIVDARNIFDLQTGIFTEEGGLKLSGSGRMLRGAIQVRF